MATFQDAAAIYLNDAVRTVERELGVRAGPIRVISVHDDMKHILANIERGLLRSGKPRPRRVVRSLANSIVAPIAYGTIRWKNRFGGVIASTLVGQTRSLMITNEEIDSDRSVEQLEGTVYHEAYHVGLYRYALTKGVTYEQIETLPKSLNEGFAEAAAAFAMHRIRGKYIARCHSKYLTWAVEILERTHKEYGYVTVRTMADLALTAVEKR